MPSEKATSKIPSLLGIKYKVMNFRLYDEKGNYIFDTIRSAYKSNVILGKISFLSNVNINTPTMHSKD